METYIMYLQQAQYYTKKIEREKRKEKEKEENKTKETGWW